MQFKDYKPLFIEMFLDNIWKQWSALGVAGHESLTGCAIIDPEALILFTTAIGRYDQRLFDEVQDWIVLHERFISVGRLSTMVIKSGLGNRAVLAAIAAQVGQKNKTPKWKKLALMPEPERQVVPESLFYLLTGSPVPVLKEPDPVYSRYGYLRSAVLDRKLAMHFPPRTPQTLLLTLRALFGVTSRCEAFAYLLTHDAATIQQIATYGYFSWRSIQDVLFEMSHSGIVTFPIAKRGRTYRLSSADTFRKILLTDDTLSLRLTAWPPVFRACQVFLECVSDPALNELSVLGQALALRKVMDSTIIPLVAEVFASVQLPDTTNAISERYIDECAAFIRNILFLSM